MCCIWFLFLFDKISSILLHHNHPFSSVKTSFQLKKSYHCQSPNKAVSSEWHCLKKCCIQHNSTTTIVALNAKVNAGCTSTKQNQVRLPTILESGTTLNVITFNNAIRLTHTALHTCYSRLIDWTLALTYKICHHCYNNGCFATKLADFSAKPPLW